jgi:hypothetical protein
LKRRPLGSAGSFGQVPPLHRYYGTLRLPAVPLAALRCLRLAIPSCRPVFVPVGLGRGPRIILELVSRVSGRPCDGNGRVSQVPERPSCPCALFLDPGRTDARQAIAASRRGPRLCQPRRLPHQRRFRGSIPRHWDWLSTLRREGHPSAARDSLPAAGQALPGGVRSPAGLHERFPSSSLFLLSRACLTL